MCSCNNGCRCQQSVTLTNETECTPCSESGCDTTIGGGAVLGALLGSAGGPIGAVVGGVVGACVGAVCCDSDEKPGN